MKIRITHDVYEIAKRIRYIDKDYYIIYDTSKKVFEVHNSSQLDTTYCLTIPFNTLDIRTLEYVYESMSANIDKIIEKIENDNQLRENADRRCVLSQFNDTLETEMERS